MVLSVAMGNSVNAFCHPSQGHAGTYFTARYAEAMEIKKLAQGSTAQPREGSNSQPNGWEPRPLSHTHTHTHTHAQCHTHTHTNNHTNFKGGHDVRVKGRVAPGDPQ